MKKIPHFALGTLVIGSSLEPEDLGKEVKGYIAGCDIEEDDCYFDITLFDNPNRIVGVRASTCTVLDPLV